MSETPSPWSRGLQRANSILGVLCAGGAAIALGAAAPHFVSHPRAADFTGDGIPDVMYSGGLVERLLVGQESGTYLRAEGKVAPDGTTYFETPEGIAYRFDGKFYRPPE